MDGFVIIFSGFMALIGLLMKAQPNIINPYSSMSAEKLENVNLRAIGNLFCKGFLIIAVLMVALYYLFKVLGMPTVAQGVWFTPILLVTPILIVMAQKYDKNPRGGFKKYLPAGIVVVITVIVVAMLVWGVQSTKAVIEGDRVRFTGQYGVMVALGDIARCELRETIPRITARTNGLGLGNICKGWFRLEELGRCRLLIRRGNVPYLLIETKKGEKIIFNSPDPALTEGLFEVINQ